MITPLVFAGFGYAATPGANITGAKREYWEKQNNFYHCRNEGGDVIGYFKRKGAIEEDVLSYDSNRPGSTGLFGPEGFYTEDEQQQMRKELRRRDNVVYHGVISFDEAYGEKYFNDTIKAMKLVNEVFPKFLARAGFSNKNVTWFAAYHTNTDNPHVHVGWYEHRSTHESRDKEGHRVVTYAKGKIPQQAIDYLKFSIVEYCESDLKSRMDYKLRSDITSQLAKNTKAEAFRATIVKLGYSLETKDTYQYNKLSNKDQKLVDEYTNLIIGDDGLKMIENYRNSLIEEQNRQNAINSKINKKDDNEFVDKRIKELYSRCGNCILRVLEHKAEYNLLKDSKTAENRLANMTLIKLMTGRDVNKKNYSYEYSKFKHQTNKNIETDCKKLPSVLMANLEGFIMGFLTTNQETESNNKHKVEYDDEELDDDEKKENDYYLE